MSERTIPVMFQIFNKRLKFPTLLRFWCSNLFILLSLSACLSVLPTAEPSHVSLYRLAPSFQNTNAQQAKTHAVSLSLSVPYAPRILAGQNIIIAFSDHKLSPIGGAKWADTIPQSWQRAMIENINQNTTALAVVQSSKLRAKYRLDTNIKRFETVFSHENIRQSDLPHVHIVVEMRIVDIKNRALFARTVIEMRIQSPSKTVSDIIRTYNKATGVAMQETAEWLIDVLKKP